MRAMIGSARTINPTAEGSVRKTARRMALANVERKRPISPSAEAREITGRVTVATATPKTPSGSCMSRKA